MGPDASESPDPVTGFRLLLMRGNKHAINYATGYSGCCRAVVVLRLAHFLKPPVCRHEIVAHF